MSLSLWSLLELKSLELNFSCSIYFGAVEAELHAEKLLKLHGLVHAILASYIYNKNLKGDCLDCA